LIFLDPSCNGLGIDLEGNKDVLGLWIAETESAKYWLGVLTELRNRGLKDILIITSDDLSGIQEAIKAVYPDAAYQGCVVHIIRNSLKLCIMEGPEGVQQGYKAHI